MLPRAKEKYMVSASKPKPTRMKVGEHRARLRAQGLLPIQIWVPDVRENRALM